MNMMLRHGDGDGAIVEDASRVTGRGPDPMSILPASSHLEIKSFYAARDALAFHDACAVRYNIFVTEQGFPAENEFDKVDETCVHLLAYYVSPAWGGRSVPVGTLRLQALPNSTVVKLGRIAVMKPHRQQGIARRMVTVAENIARSMGMTGCFMHAQADKIPVYEKFGYQVGEGAEGNEIVTMNDVEGVGTDRRGQFLEDGVWHVKMHKNILQAS